MDATALIEQALIAGAAAGAKDATTSAVRNDYEALRTALRRRFTGHRLALDALDTSDSVASGEWRESITDALAETDASDDREVVAAAADLLAQTDPAGTISGKYAVDARNTQGLQVGNGNIQFNTFS